MSIIIVDVNVTLISFRIQGHINKANKQLSKQREDYKKTERCILNAEKAYHAGFENLLSKFKEQKGRLQATRQHIAELSEKGIAVRVK